MARTKAPRYYKPRSCYASMLTQNGDTSDDTFTCVFFTDDEGREHRVLLRQEETQQLLNTLRGVTEHRNYYKVATR